MALLFCDSFDHYTTSELTRKWASAHANFAIEATGGRRGGGCLRTDYGGNAATVGFAPTDVVVFGMAVKLGQWSNTGDYGIAQLYSGGSTQIYFRIMSGGSVEVRDYSGGSLRLITSASAPISLDTWFYFEARVKISATVGEVEVRINGSTIINVTGTDVRNNSDTVDTLQITGGGNTAGIYQRIDDLYICDDAGSTCNTFLGDVRIDAYLPAANGNSSGFVGSDADSTDNYLLVDETSPDSDTTYVQSNTASAKDTYAFTEMSHTPQSIIATQLCAMGKKTDAGTRPIHLVTRSGSTDYDTATALNFGTDYQVKRKVDEIDPATAAAWTKSNLNNAEFGIKVVS